MITEQNFSWEWVIYFILRQNVFFELIQFFFRLNYSGIKVFLEFQIQKNYGKIKLLKSQKKIWILFDAVYVFIVAPDEHENDKYLGTYEISLCIDFIKQL